MALNLTVASHIFIMDPWWNPGTAISALLSSAPVLCSSALLCSALLCSAPVYCTLLYLAQHFAAFLLCYPLLSSHRALYNHLIVLTTIEPLHVPYHPLLAAEMQAIDRTHRLGQHKPIFATRFIIGSSAAVLCCDSAPPCMAWPLDPRPLIPCPLTPHLSFLLFSYRLFLSLLLHSYILQVLSIPPLSFQYRVALHKSLTRLYEYFCREHY